MNERFETIDSSDINSLISILKSKIDVLILQIIVDALSCIAGHLAEESFLLAREIREG